MATYALTQERPVMTRQLLGRVPKDSYVQDRPFVPNVADLSVGEMEVFENAPELDAGGGLKLLHQVENVEANPFHPSLRAVTCGLISGVTAATVGALTGGAPAAIAAGLTALTLGAGTGYLSARNDQISVVTHEQTVTTPVMTGYRMGTLNEAFSPVKDKGTLHYAVPTIEQRPVGLARVQELQHSAMGTEKAALLSAALGVAVGLAAGYLPVPVMT